MWRRTYQGMDKYWEKNTWRLTPPGSSKSAPCFPKLFEALFMIFFILASLKGVSFLGKLSRGKGEAYQKLWSTYKEFFLVDFFFILQCIWKCWIMGTVILNYFQRSYICKLKMFYCIGRNVANYKQLPKIKGGRHSCSRLASITVVISSQVIAIF